MNGQPFSPIRSIETFEHDARTGQYKLNLECGHAMIAFVPAILTQKVMCSECLEEFRGVVEEDTETDLTPVETRVLAGDAPLLHNSKPGRLKNLNYGLLAYEYLLGQIRLQLTDVRRRDPTAPDGHGQIVRELCTYSPITARTHILGIRLADDPEAYCAALATDFNCEGAGGRIRLDNKNPKENQ